MIRFAGLAVFLWCGILTMPEITHAAEKDVPEPFRGFDETSTYAINYDDLTAVLRTVVVDVGLSTRRVASQTADITGTRVKSKIKKTANEGNRFYFETFEDNEESQQFMLGIQESLEQLPAQAPLRYFSRDEQLAYWLNLYNVTVLNEIIKVYPKRDLKKLFRGKKSIFDQKLLNVAGIPLSLNDIQFTILKQNYENDPLIIYGLYQGIIGGPNIGKTAYVGSDVRRALESNAYEFINSNRGTYIWDEKTFRVSSLYDRNSVYFPDFKPDLTQHLLEYLKGKERTALQAASNLKPNIDDWDVTDLTGTHRRVGGSFATSRAALMDAVQSTVPGKPSDPLDGSTLGAAVGAGSSSTASKGQHLSRIEPELLVILQELNDKRQTENQRKAQITIEDLDDSSVDPAAVSEEEQEQ